MSPTKLAAQEHADTITFRLNEKKLVLDEHARGVANFIADHLREHFFQPAVTGPNSISIGPGAMPAEPAPQPRTEVAVFKYVNSDDEMANDVAKHIMEGWKIETITSTEDGNDNYTHFLFLSRVKPT